MGRIVLPVYTPHYLPNGNEVAVIETSRGTIRVELAGKDVPVTTGNFIELAARGFYENLKFHAHKPGSVVLGGCPTTRTLGPAQVDSAARGLIRGTHPGTGDARYTIVDEWETNPNNKHVLGSLCFAHKSEPNSGSCQFYFSLSEQPEFDDKFTVFGQTVEGLDVVEQLTIGDIIKSIVIEGADDDALAEAISHETPRPKSAREVLEELERRRAENEAAAQSQDVVEADGLPVEGQA
ncbi:peptidylprolyl isomerase [Paraeggerthella hongkongensis]|uniref:peptidylprolyl isomerase n=1 Tax=Paraeggerthella hominis TaxID=2897351 RepID=UPI001C0FEB75|nr:MULTISPECIES: peptidylprolyl isomerase [Paraeggerthella]MBU5404809.1 peptidylprolyl isomerase [Paraeggerthella hongkongensis]MCD2433203.1 peptidylprolyl isomerase [Paraeggerthella hominis]